MQSRSDQESGPERKERQERNLINRFAERGHVKSMS